MTLPSYRYHPELAARVVATEAEAGELAASGWYETPADFPPPAPAKPAKK